jgi:hypothetical protein
VRCTELWKTALGRSARAIAVLGLWPLSACHTPMPPDAHRPGVPPGTAAAPAAPAVPYSRPARTSDEYKMQIASKLVAANPSITYMGVVPQPLLAIPILEIEVNADGSVRRIEVTRRPADADAQDTIQIAIDAVRRAAPFGDVRQVPKPWKFTEVFLFDDERRFKPRVLD